MRRLKRDPSKLRQCLQGATGVERQSILEMLDVPDACKKAAPDPEDCQACKKAKSAKETSSAKAAEAGGQGSSSSPSLTGPEDPHGWPAILNSPKAVKEEEVKENDGKLQGAAG